MSGHVARIAPYQQPSSAMSRHIIPAIAISLTTLLFACDADEKVDSPVTDNGMLDSSGAPSSATDWWQVGARGLQARQQVIANHGTAKNVILFVGDGMGVTTVTASRIYDGQVKGRGGEENTLSFDVFPHTALIKTYTNNLQVSQSAATATAMNTGIKTSSGVINIAPNALRGNCTAALGQEVKTLAEYAEEKGMSTGVVTTATLTHATGAAVYAHSAERMWEGDYMMPDEALEAGCKDIARQFVEFDHGDGIDIALGGGERNFFGRLKKGYRKNPDDDLVQEWVDSADGRVYVDTAEALAEVGQQNTQILGLFSSGHMPYELDHNEETTAPTIVAMTQAAINHLSKNEKGYYLMVESGRIDHGHHQGQAEYALKETQAFSDAIAAALEMVDLNETLVLVTADHSHTMTIGGYPMRGNPILGNVRENDMAGLPKQEDAVAMDGKTYSTLGYYNGPGAVEGHRHDAPPVRDAGNKPAVQQAVVPTFMDMGPYGKRVSETHGGEDVALYAIGPKAHLVGGTMEQNVIFHLMVHALGWDGLELTIADKKQDDAAQ